MSISSQLLILNQTKENIKQAINLKGVEVTDEPFAEYPDKIRQIPNGGGIYDSTIIAYLQHTLTQLEIPAGTTKIRDGAFYESSLRNGLTIPDSVTSIGGYAFQNSEIKKLVIPSSVTSIGEAAFRYSDIESITIPNSVTTIGKYAFETCVKLTSIEIPDSVSVIEDALFYTLSEAGYRSTLETVVIGTGVTSIGSKVFSGCRAIQSLTIKAISPPTIVSDTFSNINDFPIYVPSGSVLAYQTADIWMNYASRIQAIPS